MARVTAGTARMVALRSALSCIALLPSLMLYPYNKLLSLTTLTRADLNAFKAKAGRENVR